MRIVTLPNQKVVRKRHRHQLKAWLLLCLLLGSLTALYFRPLPPATISLDTSSVGGRATSIAWPTGEAAFSADGFDFLESSGSGGNISTASIAKVITVLCVLEKRPLALGETGPTVTMTAADAARYHAEVARNGTSYAVSEGDMLTEYEMLEAILLPSANNIADTAAIWAFGSLDAYRAYAQSFVENHDMTSTLIGPDASGYDPSTTSTPKDLVTLAKLALNNPVVMEIAGKPSAILEGWVPIRNHNAVLGTDGITGLKTGLNDGNTGSLLFTATVGPEDSKVNVAGIVANAGTLQGALNNAARLVDSLKDDFPVTTVFHSDEHVGTLRTAWGSEADIVTTGDVQLQHWVGSKIYVFGETHLVSGTKKESIGKIYAKANGRKSSANLTLAAPAPVPTLWWRITHIR